MISTSSTPSAPTRTEVLRVRLPLDAERCLRTNCTVATGPLTVGTSTAFFAQNRQASSAYVFGFTAQTQVSS